jgi:BioD-like phosphotransacetylase family protein
MTPLLVTSTADGTGKTAITIALASIARADGETAGYMKPKGTRLESAVGKTRDKDPMLAREVLDLDAPIEDLEPVVYSPTFVQEAIRGRSDADELRESITSAYERLAEVADVMLLEGGKLWTGSAVDLSDRDVAELLDADVVLVAEFEEYGDVDELIAAADVLGDRLVGVLFNRVSSSMYDEVADHVVPFLAGRGVETLGILPHDRDLGGVTVAELSDSIGAELLTPEAPTDGRVDRFVVGAMGSKAALEQFRRTRDGAVITGGDRSDIQTTALEASGVSCLVLTGGYRPSNAVLGKAASRDVPALLVRSDTRTTVDKVEQVIRSGRTQRREAVDRMADLLRDNADTDHLLEQ